MTTLDDLAAAAEKATPGPWHHHPHDLNDAWPESVYYTSDHQPSSVPRLMVARADTPDARFIALADPTTVLRLVAVARAADALPDLDMADKGFGPTASKRDIDAFYRGRKRLRAALAALEEVR